jgi:hypothetical protein
VRVCTAGSSAGNAKSQYKLSAVASTAATMILRMLQNCGMSRNIKSLSAVGVSHSQTGTEKKIFSLVI